MKAPGVRRIVIVTPRFRGPDGISRLSEEIVAALSATAKANGMRLELWSLADGGEESEEDQVAGLVRLRVAAGSRIRLGVWGVLGLAGDVRHTLVFVLHLHLSPVAVAMRLMGARVAIFLNGIEAWKALRWRERLMLRLAHALIANSSETVRRFKTANPEFKAADVSVCPLGIPSEAVGNQHDGGFALIVGRMAVSERYKGHDLLLDLWPRVLNRLPSALLVVVGDGDDRERLQQKAIQLGLEKAVSFVGQVSDLELQRLYREAGFFVMPSTGEGFGLVFLEAMRAGRACIGATGAAAEVIEDGVTGCVVNPERRNEVLAALVRLFEERTVREAMGRAGRARYVEKFTHEQFRHRLYPLLGIESP